MLRQLSLFRRLMRVCFKIKYFIGLVIRREEGKHRTFCVSDWDLVKTSPARQMAGSWRNRTAGGFGVSILFSDWKTDPPQLQGLSIVGLHPKRVNLGLRRSSLITSEDSLWKWIRDFNLPWVAFGQSVSLSKTTKLILLDSLLQEVCIKSDLAGCSTLSSLRLSVCLIQSIFIQD